MIRSHNPFYCTKFPIEEHPNYKYLEDYDKANAFDVRTIHSVTVAEFERTYSRQKVDTNSNLPTPEPEKIDIFFQRSQAKITYETYGDIEQYADVALLSNVSEEYADSSPRYGALSPLERLDLGEPIRQPREEVMEDADDSRTLVAGQDCCYAVPEDTASPVEGLDADTVAQANVPVTAHYAEAIPDDYLSEFEAEVDADAEMFP